MSDGEFYCADCGEPKEGNEPNCGGRESGDVSAQTGCPEKKLVSSKGRSAPVDDAGSIAAANPVAHDHEVGLDVAGCRGCYLEGSRWPWPGGSNPVQEKRIRALEAEVERLKRYLNEEPALPEEREAVD